MEVAEVEPEVVEAEVVLPEVVAELHSECSLLIPEAVRFQIILFKTATEVMEEQEEQVPMAEPGEPEDPEEQAAIVM